MRPMGPSFRGDDGGLSQGDGGSPRHSPEAGIHLDFGWVPAFAGMTERFRGETAAHLVIPAEAGIHLDFDGSPLSRG
jgi:hypothetical protein